MGNDQAVHESATATKPRSISIEKFPDNRCVTDFVTNNHIPGNKEQGKLAWQKHRGVSDSGKGAKKQSSEGNKSGETTKHRNELVKKGVRNVNLRSSSSSRSGNLTVRVAS